MSEKVDVDRVRRIIEDAIGPWRCLNEAAEHGVNVTRARDEAIVLCMPLAPKTVRQLTNLPEISRVEFGDLEQAALEGIIENIGTYQPRRLYKGKPIQVNTHLFFRIRKRVFMEIADTHWTIMKPTEADTEDFMSDRMTDMQRETYVNTVLRPIVDPETRKVPGTRAHHQAGAFASAHDMTGERTG